MLKSVSSITNAIGALNYKGTWNAATNTPALVSGVGTKGDYYQVSVAGSTALDGISNWGVGDVVAFNGTTWQRIEGGADLNGVNLSVSGTSTLSGLTASTALALDASKNVVSVTNTGTGNNVLATSPILTTPNIGAATGTQLDIDNLRLDGNILSSTDSNGNVSVIPNGSGLFLVNKTSGNPFHTNAHVLLSDETVDGSGALIIENSNSTNGTSIFVGVGAAGVGYNASICVLGVYRCNTNSRSINAAGSINASGLDYAEYMVKSGDFTIAKGDVVGINAQGLLTDKFSDAVTFAVKSTDPSYVGGDVWGREDVIGVQKPVQHVRKQLVTEDRVVFDAVYKLDDNGHLVLVADKVVETVVIEPGDTDAEWQVKVDAYQAEKAIFDAALEAARQKVDRIAFAGQVPVNVVGAAPGQYIVPFNDNGLIKGVAMSDQDMQLKDYMSAIGRVIAVEADGRARIIVKIS